jgi:hypothetical protein
MQTLLLPVAGRSSRFPGMRPKWLLTMPDGQLMVEKSIEGINAVDFDRIVLICLREHLDTYFSKESFATFIGNFRSLKIETYILDEPTRSQSETVFNAIKNLKIEGSIFIKDCDNKFTFDYHGGNEVAVCDLNTEARIDPRNKSYVTANNLGYINNIVEKSVVSNFFCCGGYGFDDANEFIRYYENIQQVGEIYVSNVIYRMLLNNVKFKMSAASNYIDWGTLLEYRNFIDSFKTIFCDVDGVLFANGSKFGNNAWKTEPLLENIQPLVELQKKGLLYLIITSSRPESETEYIKNTLHNNGLAVNKFIMDLPHCKRILINDYAKTNPFPSAVAINIERDSRNLSNLI